MKKRREQRRSEQYKVGEEGEEKAGGQPSGVHIITITDPRNGPWP